MSPLAMADLMKEVGKRSIRLGSELTGRLTGPSFPLPGTGGMAK
jgi:hypothetical protein